MRARSERRAAVSVAISITVTVAASMRSQSSWRRSRSKGPSGNAQVMRRLTRRRENRTTVDAVAVIDMPKQAVPHVVVHEQPARGFS